MLKENYKKNLVKRTGLLTLFAFFVCGCSTLYNTATGRNEFIFISTPQEISMGKTIHQQISATEKISTDDARVARIERIGRKLAQISDRQDYQYHFYLIDKNDLNAYTTPGGNIYFYTGLYDKLRSDDEIAAVLAHEIGHCAARHTVKKFQAGLGYDLLSTLALEVINVDRPTKQLAAMTSGAVMSLVFSAYSRRDENEADKLGLKYMQLAGYNLQGMIKTLEVLNDADKGGKTPLILRSHPYTKDRIESVKKEIPEIQAQFPRDN